MSSQKEQPSDDGINIGDKAQIGEVYTGGKREIEAKVYVEGDAYFGEKAEPLWSVVEQELMRLESRDEYQPFAPLLYELRFLVNAQYPTADMAHGLLVIIRQLHAESRQGLNVHERVEQIANKFIEPSWRVVDQVKQENRESFHNVMCQIFRDVGSKLNLPEPAKTPIPIVLLAMTAQEAQELVSGKAFQGYPEQIQSHFDELQQQLCQQRADWLQSYQQTASEWQPFKTRSISVQELVAQVIHHLNQVHGYSPELSPVFFTIGSLTDKSNRPRLLYLRRQGCIVIMDSVSMRHPALNKAFYQSMLDASAKTSVVTIIPNLSILEAVRRMTIMLNVKFSELEFSRRKSDVEEEFGTCTDIYDAQQLDPWLSSQIRKIIPESVTKREVGIHQYMYKLS